MNKDLSVAYLVRGHSVYTRNEMEKASDLDRKKKEEFESRTYTQWFCFTDSTMPASTSEIDIASLPDIGYDSRDPEVKKAYDDLGRQNQWRCDIATSLDLLSENQKKVDDPNVPQSEIAMWRDLKRTSNKNGFITDYYITKNKKNYKRLAKIYGIEHDKPFFIKDLDEKYLDYFTAFVVDKIIQIRSSTLSADGDYTLYDITNDQRKLIKSSNINDDQAKEREKRARSQIKTIEKGILKSQIISRSGQIRNGSRKDANNISIYNSIDRSKTSSSISPSDTEIRHYNTSITSGSKEAWKAILALIVLIILMFIIFAQ